MKKNKIIMILAALTFLSSCQSKPQEEEELESVDIHYVVSSEENESDIDNEEHNLYEKQYEEKINDNENKSDIEDEDDRFEKVVINRVVDGDTAEVVIDGEKLKVRFIGVDTPETKHPKKGVQYFGPEAYEFTKKELEGKVVFLEKDVSDRDRYNRLLRYIWLEKPNDINNISNEEIEEKMFNAILLKNGYAVTSTFPPDVKYESIFTKLSRRAREDLRGMFERDVKKS